MRAIIWAVCLFGLSGAALANDSESSDQLTMELNTLSDVSGGCQMTFVAQSSHTSGIEQAVFEVVLFDKAGAVKTLTLFDFGMLPSGRPRVRQFVMPNMACTDLGSLMINGASTCTTSELNSDACISDLSLSSRTDVGLIG